MSPGDSARRNSTRAPDQHVVKESQMADLEEESRDFQPGNHEYREKIKTFLKFH